MALNAERISQAQACEHMLCNLPIMVGAGYITQEEADTLRPLILAILRERLELD